MSMNSKQLFSLVLDVGAAMVRCGGETHRVEDTIYRMLSAFDFQSCNVWVVPSNLQATVTDAEGTVMTQIRHVRGSSIDFETLDRLALGMTAPAHGLELTEVRYPEKAFTDPAALRWHEEETC